MDTFSFFDYSIDHTIRNADIFANKCVHGDILLNTPDKRFKLKPSTLNYQSVEQQPVLKQQQQPQQQAGTNTDLLKMNLSNKKELKKKLLNFDINRNFEDIYWLSLKEKPCKALNQNFPPIFDKNFFKPKHGMNNYQLIKFEHRYQQQQLLQQQQQQQQQLVKSNSKSNCLN